MVRSLTEYDRCPGVDEPDKVIRKTIEDPTYSCENPAFHVKYIDGGDCYCAFVGDKDMILAKDYCGKTLKMNIHNMTSRAKPYYFLYEETEFDGGKENTVIHAISVRLLAASSYRQKI